LQPNCGASELIVKIEESLIKRELRKINIILERARDEEKRQVLTHGNKGPADREKGPEGSS
jgi:hypothetical protein